jgi:hypothetical protein
LIEPRIKVVFFAAVAGATEGLQVANVVATAAGQEDECGFLCLSLIAMVGQKSPDIR